MFEMIKIEFKHTFPLKVWFILLQNLNVENLQIHLKVTSCWKWKISIVDLLSPTYTSLDNLKNRVKSTIIF